MLRRKFSYLLDSDGAPAASCLATKSY